MKIAWIMGTELSADDFSVDSVGIRNSGGWNNTQIRSLYESNEVEELIVVSVRPQKHSNYCEKTGKLSIYHLDYSPISFQVNMKLIDEIYEIIKNTNPDIIDIQGAETTYSAITYLKKMPSATLVTIHGVAFQCDRFYSRGLPPYTLLIKRTVFDWLTFKGVIEKNILMKKRAIIEDKILKSVAYVRGRTAWDKACVLSKNAKINYYSEELILRREFYEKKWDINQCNSHRIFATQANSPLKSIYTSIETISLLKNKYPDVQLVIPGHPLRSGFKKNGYEKTIYKRIKELKVEGNIVFTGSLDAAGIVNELLSSRVFLLQSEIENSPNSLAEAQLLGVPCVASFTGGTPEYVQHGETGFLYNSYDPVMAAMYIERLFENDALCCKLSDAERTVARNRHNERDISCNLINIYKEIILRETVEGMY